MSFLFLLTDCRSNGKLQEFFHPGLFVNNKWSCCDHRSKHSYGCSPAFVKDELQFSSSPPASMGAGPLSTSPTRGGGAIQRKPLPPTPQDNGGPAQFGHSTSQEMHHHGGGGGYGGNFPPGGGPTTSGSYGQQNHFNQSYSSQQMTVSTTQHQRGHGVMSYQHHNPPGLTNEAPPPSVSVAETVGVALCVRSKPLYAGDFFSLLVLSLCISTGKY